MTAYHTNLRPFHGGLQLDPRKEQSTGRPLARFPLPDRLVLALQQHIGEPAEPLVEIGDRVKKGQIIARAAGYVSVPVHASSSGTVTDIGDYPVPHPSGLAAPCIVIETDGEDEWVEHVGRPIDYEQLDPSALRNRIREAGIVGLGGAGFPSFIKLNPGTRPCIDYLILNGAECEPYISCDDMLMRERPREIVGGLKIMRHALQAAECIIGIEDNKLEAFTALAEAIRQENDPSIHVVHVPTIYPAGGEKQLIKMLTGREVPSNGLPLEVGTVCHNVATAAAVHDAFQHARPLISRIVTVSGRGIRQPRNLEVPFGTSVRELLEYCGGYTEQVHRLIIGGPMMGFTLSSDEVPVTKTTNCVLAADRAEAPDPQPALPCIRCGACAEVCPAVLLPQQLYWYAHSKDFDKVQDYHLFDCIECGCCAYVCPSHIPLVQYFRFAKTEIWAQERDKQKADLARRRHEFHIERLEREKREREERSRRKKAALKEDKEKNVDRQKKEEIRAAVERARAKKADMQAKSPERAERSKAEARQAAGEDAQHEGATTASSQTADTDPKE